VVIIRAGFGGLSAAKELAGSALDVTLIDRHNYHLFQPLLYQVATAGLAPSDIAAPIRGIVSHASERRTYVIKKVNSRSCAQMRVHGPTTIIRVADCPATR